MMSQAMSQARHELGAPLSRWTRERVAILTFSIAVACSDTDSPAQPGNPDDGGTKPNPGAAAGTIAYVRGGEIRPADVASGSRSVGHPLDLGAALPSANLWMPTTDGRVWQCRP